MADEEEAKDKRQEEEESQADKAVNIASGMTNNAVEGVKNIASNTVSKVSEETSAAIEKATEMLSNPSVLYGLIAVIIIAVICVAVVYYFIANAVFNKKSIIIEKTKFPIKGNVKSVIMIENFPSSGNGLRRTYTFWVYVNDVNNAGGKPKHIFSIGNDSSGTSITDKSPVVVLKDSKLHICFPTSDTTNVQNAPKNVDEIGNGTKKDNTVSFDYLPMQRWVHIAVVITDDYQGSTVSLYMDAQLASSTTNEKDGTTLKGFKLDTTGSLIVGGDNSATYGFNGLLSKVGIHNYDLNSRDIYNIYSEGPIDGLLASLGYGVRAPLYKLAD
tara:strand:+ start:45 stop:1031 length:987 start_codon:yes stop_codon:yes gene_type:complete